MNLNSQFWLAWNWFTFLPLLFCLVYRFFTREDYVKVGLKSYTLDTIIRILLAPSLVYYVIDCTILVAQVEFYGWCNLAFFLHHVFTLAGYRASLTLEHVPWFFLAAFPCHCLLIMFPYHTDLNYLYLVIILNCLYQMQFDPWRNNPKVIWLVKVIVVLLAVPIDMLWWFECKNDMQNVD